MNKIYKITTRYIFKKKGKVVEEASNYQSFIVVATNFEDARFAVMAKLDPSKEVVDEVEFLYEDVLISDEVKDEILVA